jgi:hypothetical protein
MPVSPASSASLGRFYEARFEVPHVGNADTFAYYIEAKYKFTPQFWRDPLNQQLFGTVSDGYGHNVQWSHKTSAESTSPQRIASRHTLR